MHTNQQKLTSPSGFVLVNISAREPARQPVFGTVCDQSASGSEFEVGGTTFGEDITRRASGRAPLASGVES